LDPQWRRFAEQKCESERGASPLRFAATATDLMGHWMSCAHLPNPSDSNLKDENKMLFKITGHFQHVQHVQHLQNGTNGANGISSYRLAHSHVIEVI
jgi:hypothetical protein